VNAVMATDISDPKLRAFRDERWYKAFSNNNRSSMNNSSSKSDKKKYKDGRDEDVPSRKATIVIEHLVLASNVAHTMQHWHVYHKWNERLFAEAYKAYKEGRSEKDPAEYWYKGEIVFFDGYIIPLAQKLKDCGVFGVAGDEYLQYAVQNRSKWEEQGQHEVNEMVLKVTGGASSANL
jgi:hypothetical protein